MKIMMHSLLTKLRLKRLPPGQSEEDQMLLRRLRLARTLPAAWNELKAQGLVLSLFDKWTINTKRSDDILAILQRHVGDAAWVFSNKPQQLLSCHDLVQWGGIGSFGRTMAAFWARPELMRLADITEQELNDLGMLLPLLSKLIQKLPGRGS